MKLICSKVLKGPEDWICCLKEYGGFLYSGSKDYNICAWNDEDRDPVVKLEGHKAGVRVLHVHNGFLYSAAEDGEVRKWDQNGACVAAMKGHGGRTVWALLSFQGDLFSCGDDHKIIHWKDVDSNNPSVGQSIEGHLGAVYCMKAHDDFIFSGSADCSVRKWTPFGKQEKLATVHTQSVRCMEIFNGLLLTGGNDVNIIQWDLNLVCIRTISGHHLSAITVLREWNGHLYSAGEDYSLRVWDSGMNNIRTAQKHRDVIRGLEPYMGRMGVAPTTAPSVGGASVVAERATLY
eukprot:CAMPEP_0177639546 /NCGR_PEP_ID=MMETSP0447-20121125/6077_1 /TAXON_ID=0 /ORGANISM="Stygamoeba regulata, Strain BSH-02190019" /LENGTH=290 /DNA_ID=CAMNT_0019141577 /DNA_START=169 /DNA_END=1039 /DNA_ORIENTATION=-